MAKNGRDVSLRQVLSTRRIQRNDKLRRRERDERERRRRLADMHAVLSGEALATLRHRAEETLANDGVARTRLGYEVLVKLKVDELLERGSLRMAVEDDQASLAGAATALHAEEASVRRTSGTRGDGEPGRCRSIDLDCRRDRALQAASPARSAACSGRSVRASPCGGSPIGVWPVPTCRHRDAQKAASRDRDAGGGGSDRDHPTPLAVFLERLLADPLSPYCPRCSLPLEP
jgi:hypothetical protein